MFGPPVYTSSDAISDLLRFADLSCLDVKTGKTYTKPTPHGRSWRARFGRQLILALRGVP